MVEIPELEVFWLGLCIILWCEYTFSCLWADALSDFTICLVQQNWCPYVDSLFTLLTLFHLISSLCHQAHGQSNTALTVWPKRKYYCMQSDCTNGMISVLWNSRNSMATHPHSTLELNWFGCETSNILLPEVKYQGMHMHPSTPWCNGWHLKCTLAGLANVLNNASSNAIDKQLWRNQRRSQGIFMQPW
jgi:hypothetical protein